MKFTALSSLLATLTLPAPAMIVSTFAADFHGTVQPDTLAASDIAGVIPTTNWIPAYDLTGGTSGLSSTGTGGTFFLGWDSGIDGVIGGSSSANPDEDMMEGYIAGFVDAAGSVRPAVVQLSTPTLPSLGWDFYDLYVYSDQGVTPANLALVTFNGSSDPTSTLSHLEHSSGYGAGAPGYLDSQVSPDGNYVKYSGLTSSTLSLMAIPDSGSNSAAINGIELVGYSNVPEPSTSLALVLGTGLLAFRRKRSEFRREA